MEAQQLFEQANQIAKQVTALHPLVGKLAESPERAEMLKAVFELTKQVEVIKKQALRLQKRDESGLL